MATSKTQNYYKHDIIQHIYKEKSFTKKRNQMSPHN